MKTKFAICTLFFLLFITACAGPAAQPTTTPVDVNAVATDVAATVVANITEQAAAFTPTLEEPTATATLELTLTPGVIDTPTITVTPTENECDKMEFVSDVTIPDNSEMTPGQDFVKTWKVKNTGACPWRTNYILVYGWGDNKMGGQNTALTAEIAPDTEGEISITLKAPTPLGTYKSYWRLQNNNGFNFGTPLSVVIVVK